LQAVDQKIKKDELALKDAQSFAGGGETKSPPPTAALTPSPTPTVTGPTSIFTTHSNTTRSSPNLTQTVAAHPNDATRSHHPNPVLSLAKHDAGMRHLDKWNEKAKGGLTKGKEQKEKETKKETEEEKQKEKPQMAHLRKEKKSMERMPGLEGKAIPAEAERAVARAVADEISKLQGTHQKKAVTTISSSVLHQWQTKAARKQKAKAAVIAVSEFRGKREVVQKQQTNKVPDKKEVISKEEAVKTEQDAEKQQIRASISGATKAREMKETANKMVANRPEDKRQARASIDAASEAGTKKHITASAKRVTAQQQARATVAIASEIGDKNEMSKREIDQKVLVINGKVNKAKVRARVKVGKKAQAILTRLQEVAQEKVRKQAAANLVRLHAAEQLAKATLKDKQKVVLTLLRKLEAAAKSQVKKVYRQLSIAKAQVTRGHM